MRQPGGVRDRFLHRARPVTCTTATTAHCAHGENTHTGYRPQGSKSSTIYVFVSANIKLNLSLAECL